MLLWLFCRNDDDDDDDITKLISMHMFLRACSWISGVRETEKTNAEMTTTITISAEAKIEAAT